MEVVPTGDGEDDDGVVWYRCPQCKGFLPKLKGTDPAAVAAADTAASEDSGADSGAESPPAEPDPVPESDEDLPWDSPADMMASRGLEQADAPAGAAAPKTPDPAPGAQDDKPDPVAQAEAKGKAKPEPEEPIQEYIDMLDGTDQGDPRPYRPWDTYEVGECILHLAWEDCGVVVAKEELPGGRQVIKCYFSGAGVVRLIEKAPR